jgi:hypothetical protein
VDSVCENRAVQTGRWSCRRCTPQSCGGSGGATIRTPRSPGPGPVARPEPDSKGWPEVPVRTKSASRPGRRWDRCPGLRLRPPCLPLAGPRLTPARSGAVEATRSVRAASRGSAAREQLCQTLHRLQGAALHPRGHHCAPILDRLEHGVGGELGCASELLEGHRLQ